MEKISRRDAQLLSLTYYFTGKVCKHGHLASRRVSNGNCLTCHLGHEAVVTDHPDFLSRKDAKRMDKSRYFTGKPCKNGHVADRYVIGGKCVVCSGLWSQQFRVNNPERYREHQRKHHQTPHCKIGRLLRTRLYLALHQQWLTGSAIKSLGCSISEFRLYLEQLFTPEMSWDNWGSIWQLDHKEPLMNFNLSDPEQLQHACHFTNLQPLLIQDHKKKTAQERATKYRK